MAARKKAARKATRKKAAKKATRKSVGRKKATRKRAGKGKTADGRDAYRPQSMRESVLGTMAAQRVPGPHKSRVEIDPESIEDMARIGLSQQSMAALLKISRTTLQSRIADTEEIREALDRGRATKEETLRSAQLQAALGGNATMLIWLGKVELGQRDTAALEITGAGGGAVSLDLAPTIARKLGDFCRSRGAEAEADRSASGEPDTSVEAPPLDRQ